MKTVSLHYPEPAKRFVSDWECAGVAVYPAAGAVSQALCFQRQSQIKRKEGFRWVYAEIQKCSPHSLVLCLAVYT